MIWTETQLLIFKEGSDLRLWREGKMPPHLTRRISLMNALAFHYFKRPIRVTAVLKPGPFHETLEAFDVSRCSDGETAYFGDRGWTNTSAEAFEEICLRHDIPLVVVGRGTAGEHWHVGPIATKVFQVAEDPQENPSA